MDDEDDDDDDTVIECQDFMSVAGLWTGGDRLSKEPS